MYKTIFSIINVALAIWNAYLFTQNIEIAKENQKIQENLLQFQQMTYNYTSVIIADADDTFLDASEYTYLNTTI